MYFAVFWKCRPPFKLATRVESRDFRKCALVAQKTTLLPLLASKAAAEVTLDDSFAIGDDDAF